MRIPINTLYPIILHCRYMLTPFLFELRTLMDWIWTDSSMPLFEWLKMEDIFASIYELKVFFPIKRRNNEEKIL